MKVMVFVKATPNSEKGLPPAEVMQAMFEKMGAFNEKLSKAGIMKDGDGLKPSKFGKRIAFKAGGKRSVIDGPFAETKELIAGFWLWKVKSMDDAVQWLKRAPFDGGTEVEIRQVFETEDFGQELTPEARAREERLRAQLDAKK